MYVWVFDFKILVEGVIFFDLINLIVNLVISCLTGANIFLTPDGLKLGDFGCAVKLKNHTTLPGEFKTMAGTTGNYNPIFPRKTNI